MTARMVLACFSHAARPRCQSIVLALLPFSRQPWSRSFSTGQLQVQVEPLAEKLEGISVVSLNRPDAKNSLGRQLIRELRECIENLRQERSTRCVIIRSLVPGIFCSGADLKERATMTQHETAEFVGLLRKTFTEWENLPMPTIAAVDGYCLGGGAELALASDLRVASVKSIWAFPEVQLGIIPGAGGTQRLPRLLGVSKAKELIFTGRRVTGEDVLQLGLASYVVEEGQTYSRALELAGSICKGGPLALRAAKAAIAQGSAVDMHTGLTMEGAYYAQLLPTKDRMEGLHAFAEKRAPEFTGE